MVNAQGVTEHFVCPYSLHCLNNPDVGTIILPHLMKLKHRLLNLPQITEPLLIDPGITKIHVLNHQVHLSSRDLNHYQHEGEKRGRPVSEVRKERKPFVPFPILPLV